MAIKEHMQRNLVTRTEKIDFSVLYQVNPSKMVAFDLPPFKPGMAAEVRFIAPESGTTAFNIMKDDSYYMINANFQFEQKTLVLASKKDGIWGDGKVTISLPYGPGDDIAIRVEARDDHFLVYLNGKEVGQFKYRHPLSDIVKVKFFPHEGVRVISYSVYF